MAWKKIPWADEVAILTTTVTPSPVDGGNAAIGTSTEAARADHKHALGPLIADFDFNKKQALQMVVHKSSTPPSTPEEGQIYYNTEDDHLYVYVVT